MRQAPNLRLYWDTARHLRPVQIFGRLQFRAARPRADLAPAGPMRPHVPRQWRAPAPRRQSLLGPDRFRLLNDTRSLADHGWDDAALPKLWRYNLHYFDDLNAADAPARAPWHRALITRWVAENTPGQGTGWEPYPTSLRIVNWIKWARAGNTLPQQAFHSLAVQARWLEQRLEYHLLGNHLFSNAKALVFAGSFFAGPEADRWLAIGMRILAREVSEQILADGGHFELSPMYHALALEDLLDLVNMARSVDLASDRQITVWCERIDAMRGWLDALCHPDGEIAFFNDAALGIAPSPRELDLYAQRLGFAALANDHPPLRHMQNSGYVRMARGPAVALLDVARVGPDYLPGHAHADTLSFELSIKGQRAIVNSGTSVYGTGAERQRQRSTAAHNTVEIDGTNSSEVWAGFRVGRRAHPVGLSVGADAAGGAGTVVCGHDGYRHLRGRPTHWRTWKLTNGKLSVSDRIDGGCRRAVAAFHFHPALQVSTADTAARGSLSSENGSILTWRVGRGRAALAPSSWHPEFGVSQPSQRLLVELVDGESHVDFSWSDP